MCNLKKNSILAVMPVLLASVVVHAAESASFSAAADAGTAKQQSKNELTVPPDLNEGSGKWGTAEVKTLAPVQDLHKESKPRKGSKQRNELSIPRDLNEGSGKFGTAEVKTMAPVQDLGRESKQRNDLSVRRDFNDGIGRWGIADEKTLAPVQDLLQAREQKRAREPAPVWTDIAVGEMHLTRKWISGWTIFSLQAARAEPIEISIFDTDWNLLAEFDSTGCGAYVQVAPQNVAVLIMNASKADNAYVLHVYDLR